MAKKILIIDDEPDSIGFIRCVLEDHGYNNVSCLSSVAALDTARAEKPDLILLDLFMPEKGGILVFKELKEDPALERIPVVIMSGMPRFTGVDVSAFIGKLIGPSRDGVIPRFAKPEGLVDKPIEPDGLIRTIRKIINEGDM